MTFYKCFTPAVAQFAFFLQGEESRRPWCIHFLKQWQMQICGKAHTTLALRNKLFEVKAFQIIENTLEQNVDKQSGP
jgi:hypothetical protein